MPPPAKPFLTFGLPFLTFMVAGLQGLAYINRGRYEVKDEVAKQQALMSTENKVVLPPRRNLAELEIPPVTDYDIVPVPRPE
ncbi:unnamed protein product [Chondrus crispus]|uniref:Uncharacterized protein n=1 Tax=Chondrus crispus TaxID=2769 RepID=R7Q7D3_CHOCR|nr:unnamed protein product [Chondrus crispus]CDF33738.1 unnamed protein product [Chondrus crispus]|eukprot:XP_005713557.1 unnamed protein product [Chondrus crispus]